MDSSVRQRGQTALIVVSSVLGGAALVLMFVVLPYMSAKQEEAQRQLIEARKAADESARQAAEAKKKAAEAEIRLASIKAMESQARIRELDRRGQLAEKADRRTEDLHRRTEDLHQKRMLSSVDREARQRRYEDEQYARRAAAEQRNVDELKLRCEWEKKSPPGPSREARIHVACTRYDDAVRRQHVEALNRERGFR
jgi:translation initiation factor IF-2